MISRRAGGGGNRRVGVGRSDVRRAFQPDSRPNRSGRRARRSQAGKPRPTSRPPSQCSLSRPDERRSAHPTSLPDPRSPPPTMLAPLLSRSPDLGRARDPRVTARPGSAPSRAAGPVGVVRDPRWGAAGGRGVRLCASGSSTRTNPAEHEPAFRLADPPDRPADPGARGGGRMPGRHRSRPVGGRRAITKRPSRHPDPAAEVLLAAFPQVYSLAWLLVAMGLSIRLVPMLRGTVAGSVASSSLEAADPRRYDRGPRGGPLGGRSGAAGRDQGPADPPTGAPNVLLIVMDTVAADHLGLYGYGRPTSPAIDELAKRGFRFDAARRLVLDAAVPREHVHRPMAARAFGRLADPARRPATDGRRVSGSAGARRPVSSPTDVSRIRLGAGPWFRRLSRLSFPELSPFRMAAMVQRSLEGLRDDRGNPGRRPRPPPG